ncbi:MAG: hypothetical protein WBV74_02165 [Pseudonocardiaceae bacterium]
MAVVDENVPSSVMYVPVVGFTAQVAVFDAGFTIVDPAPTVMRLAHSRWPIAARKSTSAISRDERSSNGWRDGAHGPSDVEWFGFSTHDHGDYFCVTGPAAALGCTDMRAVVQGRDAEAGAQCFPVDGDGQVRWFPGGGGAVLGGAGQPADLK